MKIIIQAQDPVCSAISYTIIVIYFMMSLLGHIYTLVPLMGIN